MRVSKGKNKKLINAIENETEYTYMFKLNASNPIEKLLLNKVNLVMQEKNLTVRDACLYVFSKSVEYSDSNSGISFFNKNIDNNVAMDSNEKESITDYNSSCSKSIIPPEVQKQFDELYSSNASDENDKSDNSATIGKFLKKNFGTNY